MPATAKKLKTATTSGKPSIGSERPSNKKVRELLLERFREGRLGDKKNLSLQTIANGIGVHNATLSRVLRGIVQPSETFARKAWTWLQQDEMARRDRETGITSAPSHPSAAEGVDIGRLVNTTVTERIAKLCNYCLAERVMGMVCSETSLGKTSALRLYCHTNPSAVYIHATSRNNNSFGMVDAIWRASRAFRGAKRFREKWDDLLSFRTEGISNRLIVVDDAHILCFSALEVLRELHDEIGIGIVLAGTTRLHSRVSLQGDSHQMYEQLRARIQIARVIGKPTGDDTRAIAAAWLPSEATFTPDALKYLNQLSLGLGAFRKVKAAVRMSLRLGGSHKVHVGKEPFTRRHLELAVQQLGY